MQRRTASRPDENARHLLVSVSPAAGAKSRLELVRSMEGELSESGYVVRVTSDLEELATLASQWHADGQLRAVVACGGDGTASLVRNRVPLAVPLLPLPFGTENLLARYAGTSTSPAMIRDVIARGVVIGLDMGRVGERHFLMMISAGFDAEVIRRLHAARRGHITRASYLKHALGAIRGYAYPELQLYCDGAAVPAAEPLCGRWLFGFNLPLYACGWQLAPQAVGTDGLFDVCVFERGSLAAVIRYLWHVVWRRHHELADVHFARCRRFRILAPGGHEVAYQLDGDWAGVLPVDVELLPGELRMLVSSAVAERLGFVIPNDCA